MISVDSTINTLWFPSTLPIKTLSGQFYQSIHSDFRRFYQSIHYLVDSTNQDTIWSILPINTLWFPSILQSIHYDFRRLHQSRHYLVNSTNQYTMISVDFTNQDNIWSTLPIKTLWFPSNLPIKTLSGRLYQSRHYLVDSTNQYTMISVDFTNQDTIWSILPFKTIWFLSILPIQYDSWQSYKLIHCDS